MCQPGVLRERSGDLGVRPGVPGTGVLGGCETGHRAEVSLGSRQLGVLTLCDGLSYI